MTAKYIIDRADIYDLLTGKEISLSQSSRTRAFSVTITGNMTNGDMIKAIFPNCQKLKVLTDKKEVVVFELNDIKEWWNAPYREDGASE